MSEPKYDVIIVGASFGGCVAGKVAAEKGLKTLIVERASVPGEKIVSGTGVPATVLLEMPWIMEAPFERPINGLITHFLKGGQVQTSIEVKCPMPVAFGIYCRTFVSWLAEQATEAGAELMTSTVATDVIKERGFVRGIVTDRGEELRSPILIAADGMWSLIGIKAGVRKKVAAEDIMNGVWLDFAMPSKEDLDQALGGDNLMMFWDPAGEMLPPHGIVGYFGVFPCGRGFHFGIGTVISHLAEKRINYDKLYSRFFQIEYWKQHFGKAKLRSRMWRPYPIYASLDREQKGNDRTFGNGIMVIGDAAGFEATSSGAGIHTAMSSGKMAAEVAADALAEGDPSASFLKRYEERWKSSSIALEISDYSRKDISRHAGNEEQMKRSILEVYAMPLMTLSL